MYNNIIACYAKKRGGEYFQAGTSDREIERLSFDHKILLLINIGGGGREIITMLPIVHGGGPE